MSDNIIGYLDVFKHMDSGFFFGQVLDEIDDNSTTFWAKSNDPISIVGEADNGSLPPLDCKCRFTGRWTTHSKYGKQFHIEAIHYLQDKDAIRALLCSGFLKGIKSAKASALVDTFGSDVFTVLDKVIGQGDGDEDPNYLVRAVKGIGPKNVVPLLASWKAQRGWALGALSCVRAGISLKLARKARSEFGDRLTEVIRFHPYRLTIVRGITWEVADQVAKKEWPGKVAIGHDDPQRYTAAVREMLRQEHGKGHMCLPTVEAVALGYKLAQPNADVPAFELVVHTVKDNEGLVSHGKYLYNKDEHALEHMTAKNVAGQLKGASAKTDKWPAFEELALSEFIGLELSTGQKQAVKCALEEPFSIITGGPGTGKTTVLAAIVNIAKTHQLEVVLCAPTGKAARRMFEATECEASTIHRSLGVRGTERRKNWAGADLILVDEASMIDARLMGHVIAATPVRAHLVLIGDRDQLPSVGAGEVLHQLIESKVVPTTSLAVVHRQAEGSGIIHLAHAYNAGIMPNLARFGDAFMHQVPSNERLQPTLQRVLPSIMEKYNYDIHQVAVLTPVNGHAWGQKELNLTLRKMFNPGDCPLPGVIFRKDDPAMHIKNNYQLGVLNGMVGKVTWIASIEEEEKERQYIKENNLEDDDGNTEQPIVVKVNYPDTGTVVGYTRADLHELVLGYSFTIHKSQGSEYPAVVMLVPYTYEPFMVRALPYTGATRAREYIFVLHAGGALEKYITNEERLRRHTNLGQMVSDARAKCSLDKIPGCEYNETTT